MSADDEFRCLVERNVARIVDTVRQWTARLDREDADWLLERALAIASARYCETGPTWRSFGHWFGQCCESAARERRHWCIRTLQGREWVLSKHLRQEEYREPEEPV